MTRFLKNLLILLPALALGALYIRLHRQDYGHASGRRLLFLAATYLLLYGWMAFETFRQKRNAWKSLVQSSFFVYFFMVLTLTGYFILFREVSAHHWWTHMKARVARRDHVNLELFKIFRIYHLTNLQILGNLVLLFPLGLYLPVLYRGARRFLPVFSIALLVSAGIELLQLATSFRSADVDDVLLNTAGACLGFALYSLVRLLVRTEKPPLAGPVAT